ncbi:hypothetical protein WJX74_002841 [Apatococcus lobatus]|uniref:Uncharacterized protein n=1 Tax=Apatococcus lobatus TaxID=904363 RepID=A0AAW1QKV0_9CHLO
MISSSSQEGGRKDIANNKAAALSRVRAARLKQQADKPILAAAYVSGQAALDTSSTSQQNNAIAPSPAADQANKRQIAHGVEAIIPHAHLPVHVEWSPATGRHQQFPQSARKQSRHQQQDPSARTWLGRQVKETKACSVLPAAASSKASEHVQHTLPQAASVWQHVQCQTATASSSDAHAPAIKATNLPSRSLIELQDHGCQACSHDEPPQPGAFMLINQHPPPGSGDAAAGHSKRQMSPATSCSLLSAPPLHTYPKAHRAAPPPTAEPDSPQAAAVQPPTEQSSSNRHLGAAADQPQMHWMAQPSAQSRPGLHEQILRVNNSHLRQAESCPPGHALSLSDAVEAPALSCTAPSHAHANPGRSSMTEAHRPQSSRRQPATAQSSRQAKPSWDDSTVVKSSTKPSRLRDPLPVLSPIHNLEKAYKLMSKVKPKPKVRRFKQSTSSAKLTVRTANSRPHTAPAMHAAALQQSKAAPGRHMQPAADAQMMIGPDSLAKPHRILPGNPGLAHPHEPGSKPCAESAPQPACTQEASGHSGGVSGKGRSPVYSKRSASRMHGRTAPTSPTKELSPQEMGAKFAAAMLARIFGQPGPPSSRRSPETLPEAAAMTAAMAAAAEVPPTPMVHASTTCRFSLLGGRPAGVPAASALLQGGHLALKQEDFASACGKTSLPMPTAQQRMKPQTGLVLGSPEDGQAHDSCQTRSKPSVKGLISNVVDRVWHDEQPEQPQRTNSLHRTPRLSEDNRQVQCGAKRAVLLELEQPSGGDCESPARCKRPANISSDEEAVHEIQQQMARAAGMEVALTKVLSWLQNHLEHASPNEELLSAAQLPALHSPDVGVNGASANAADDSSAQGPQEHQPSAPAHSRDEVSSCLQNLHKGHIMHAIRETHGHPRQLRKASAAAAPCTLSPQSNGLQEGVTKDAPSASSGPSADCGPHTQPEDWPAQLSAMRSDVSQPREHEEAARTQSHGGLGGHAAVAGLARASDQLESGHEVEAERGTSLAGLKQGPALLESHHRLEAEGISSPPDLAQGSEQLDSGSEHGDGDGQPLEQHNGHPLQGTACSAIQAGSKGDEAESAIIGHPQASSSKQYEPDEVTRRHIAAIQVAEQVAEMLLQEALSSSSAELYQMCDSICEQLCQGELTAA